MSRMGSNAGSWAAYNPSYINASLDICILTASYSQSVYLHRPIEESPSFQRVSRSVAIEVAVSDFGQLLGAKDATNGAPGIATNGARTLLGTLSFMLY